MRGSQMKAGWTEENGSGGLSERHRLLPFTLNSFAFSCPEAGSRGGR